MHISQMCIDAGVTIIKSYSKTAPSGLNNVSTLGSVSGQVYPST